MPAPKPAKPGAAKPAPAKPAADAGTDQPTADSTDSTDSIGSVTDEAGELIAGYLKDVSATYTASLSSIQAGTYKVENVWADGIKMWTTYVTGMTKAFELGTRAVKTYATKPDDVS